MNLSSINSVNNHINTLIKHVPFKDTDFFSFDYKTTYWNLSDFIYHGGTTYSSGVLPKWSFDKYLIKASQGSEDIESISAIIEVVISEISIKLGFDYAEYKPIYYKYRDEPLKYGCVTKLFDGTYIPYKELVFDDMNDTVIRLVDKYADCKNNICMMYINDFLWGNSDRHGKNFGGQIIGGHNKFFTVFDSGSTFWHNSPKELKGEDVFLDKAKLTSRTNLENVIFIKDNILQTIPFDTTQYKSLLNEVLPKYGEFYKNHNVKDIIDFVTKRICRLEDIFDGSI